MSFREIGIGVAKGRLSLPVPPLAFFNRFLSWMEAKLTEVSADKLISTSKLARRLAQGSDRSDYGVDRAFP